MSLKSNDLLKTIKKGTEDNSPQIRLAKLSSVSGGKYYVQFYGEDTPSAKPYMRMRDANLQYDKPLIMQKVNGTYVIIGCVI